MVSEAVLFRNRHFSAKKQNTQYNKKSMTDSRRIF